MAKIEEPKVTPERLMQFGFAYAPPLIIGAATANKVFDTLASGAKNVEEVSRKTGASIRGLRAIMNALVGLELLKKSGDKYALTPESEAFLVSNKPGTLAGFFSMNRMRMMQQWMKLDEIVHRPAGGSAKSGGTRDGVFQRTGREHHPNELRFRTGIGRAFETSRCDKPSARSRSRLGLGNLGNCPGAKIAASASHRRGLGWHDFDNQTHHQKIWRR